MTEIKLTTDEGNARPCDLCPAEDVRPAELFLQLVMLVDDGARARMQQDIFCCDACWAALSSETLSQCGKRGDLKAGDALLVHRYAGPLVSETGETRLCGSCVRGVLACVRMPEALGLAHVLEQLDELAFQKSKQASAQGRKH